MVCILSSQLAKLILRNFLQSKKKSEIVESGDDADKEDEEDDVEEEEEVSDKAKYTMAIYIKNITLLIVN